MINYQTTANCLVFLPALFTHLHTYISTDLPTYLPDHCKLPWFLPGKSSALFTYLPTCISTDLPTYLHTYLPNCMDTYIPTYTPKLQWNLHISWGNASGLAMMKIRISVGTFGSGQLWVISLCRFWPKCPCGLMVPPAHLPILQSSQSTSKGIFSHLLDFIFRFSVF